jgi:Ca2+-binding EF-hand superfamily protein
VSTGKVGELSESDFNALFAAIDLDQSGTVDFLEFWTS